MTAVNNGGPNDLPLLLVDSEGPVAAGQTSWQHLKARDNWDKPRPVSDDQAFLMVEVMETWFIADRHYYGFHCGSVSCMVNLSIIFYCGSKRKYR